jgi:hypothetical protein
LYSIRIQMKGIYQSFIQVLSHDLIILLALQLQSQRTTSLGFTDIRSVFVM